MAEIRGAKNLNESIRFQNQSKETRQLGPSRHQKRRERRTRSATQRDTFGPHAQREALPEIHPRRRAPEHGERKDVEDRKGDDDLPAALVDLGEVGNGRTGGGQGEVADEPDDEGADRFPEGAR